MNKSFRVLLGQSGLFYPTTVSDGIVSSIKDCVAFKAFAKLTYMINFGSLVSFKFEGVRISEFPVIK